MTKKRAIVISAVVGALPLLFLTVYLLIPLIPPSESVANSAEACCLCGLTRGVRRIAVRRHGSWSVREERQTGTWPTPLHEWYVAHFGDDCQHEWLQTNDSVKMYSSLWGLMRRESHELAMDGFRGGRFILLGEGVKDALESEFASSRDGCKEFIRREMRKGFNLADDTQPTHAAEAAERSDGGTKGE